jgi:hypothetical protein
MVGSAGNAPVVASSLLDDTGFTDRQPDHFPWWTCASSGSGSGSHTHLKKFMRLLSVHWSSFPQRNGGERRVTLPLKASLQGRCITFVPRPH